jgi:hypothetical protein
MRLLPNIVEDAAETLDKAYRLDRANFPAHAPSFEMGSRFHPFVSGPRGWRARFPLELGITSPDGTDTSITLRPTEGAAIGSPIVFYREGGPVSSDEFWASILPQSFSALEILMSPRGAVELRGLPATPEGRSTSLSPSSFLLNELTMVTLDAINNKIQAFAPVT